MPRHKDAVALAPGQMTFVSLFFQNAPTALMAEAALSMELYMASTLIEGKRLPGRAGSAHVQAEWHCQRALLGNLWEGSVPLDRFTRCCIGRRT